MQLIDKDALDDFIQGDEELLADLATMFTQHLPDMEARLRVAIDDGDAPRCVSRLTNSRVVLGYFSAPGCKALAAELEERGRDDDLTGTSDTHGSTSLRVVEICCWN